VNEKPRIVWVVVPWTSATREAAYFASWYETGKLWAEWITRNVYPFPGWHPAR
jgi:hypothetical protein